MSRSTWPVAIPVGQKYPGPLVGRNAMWSGAGGPQHPALEADGTMIEMPEGAQLAAEKFGFGRSAGRVCAGKPPAGGAGLGQRPVRR